MQELKVSKKKVSNITPETEKDFTRETVSVIAIHRGYKTRPFYATSVFDNKIQRNRLGAVDLTPAQCSEAGIVVDTNSLHIVQNGDQLVLIKDKENAYVVNRDFMLYNLYLVTPEIANSQPEIRKGTHFFYMNNAEAVATESVSKKRLTGKAYSKLEESSMKDWSDMLYFFGVNPLNYSAAIVTGKVYDYADQDPQKVIDFFEKRDLNDRLVFVNKLVFHKLITKDRAGYLMYDKVGIGLGEEAAANFLYDGKNDKIYSALKGTLDTIEGHKN